MNDTRPTPRPRRCLLARVDYGHPHPAAPGWAEADLSRQPLDEALRLPRGARGLLLREAGWALAWSGTREGADLWARLAVMARRAGLVMACRFPRHARGLLIRLEAAGLDPEYWETRAAGAVPPLFEGLRHAPELLRLHLEHEWATGMGVARGGAALLRIACVLAREGALPAPDLARRLGLTAGATRAYLSWMEDAALVRRSGGAFDLRHPLLAGLFPPARETAAVLPRGSSPSKPVAPPDAEPPVWRPSSVDWD